jgi:hypothetical protein
MPDKVQNCSNETAKYFCAFDLHYVIILFLDFMLLCFIGFMFIELHSLFLC